MSESKNSHENEIETEHNFDPNNINDILEYQNSVDNYQMNNTFDQNLMYNPDNIDDEAFQKWSENHTRIINLNNQLCNQEHQQTFTETICTNQNVTNNNRIVTNNTKKQTMNTNNDSY